MAKVVSSIPVDPSKGSAGSVVVVTPSKDGGCVVVDLWCGGQDETCWGYDGGCGGFKAEPV